jgi:survival of motor neuron protein-interacting protein 1
MSQPCLSVSRRRKRDKDKETKEVGFDDIQSIDADEYLARVVRQASNLPEFSEAAEGEQDDEQRISKRRRHVPIDGSAASLAYLVSGRASLTPPPSDEYLPRNRLWIEKTIANFAKLRIYLEKCKDEGIGGKKTERIPLPPMKDRPGWHTFCVGDAEAQGNAGSYFHDDDDDDDNDDPDDSSEEEIPDWQKGIPPNGHIPSTRLVLQLDQVLVRIVLSHLCHYVSEGWSPLAPQRAAWIYALLAKLEQPIHRDDAAILFSLLKKLTQVRATLKADERTKIASLNVLIVLVGVYFEQGDGHTMARNDTGCS